MPKIVSLQEVASKVARREITLVEVLPLPYFAAGHLPGARHLPLDTFDAQVASTLPDRDGAVVVYCAGPTCKNSDVAAEWMTRLGYRDVAVFTGGKSEWVDSGRALETLTANDREVA